MFLNVQPVQHLSQPVHWFSLRFSAYSDRFGAFLDRLSELHVWFSGLLSISLCFSGSSMVFCLVRCRAYSGRFSEVLPWFMLDKYSSVQFWPVLALSWLVQIVFKPIQLFFSLFKLFLNRFKWFIARLGYTEQPLGLLLRGSTGVGVYK